MVKLLIEDLYADWCGPCKALGKSLDQLKSEFGDALQVERIDIEQFPELAERYSVSSIPMMVFKVRSEVKEKVVGNIPIDILRQKIKGYLGE